MLFYILFCFVSFLLNCLKCLIQILDDIVDVLGTDGKTDGVWFDSLIQQFFLGALAVCSGCRMDHQRFYVGNVSQQGEQLQIVDEIFAFCASPLISKVKMEPPPFGKYLRTVPAALDLRIQTDDVLFTCGWLSRYFTTFSAFST